MRKNVVNSVNSKLIPGYETKTVSGNVAKIICFTNDGKLLVSVSPKIGRSENFKYQMNGFRFSKSSPCPFDLVDAGEVA